MEFGRMIYEKEIDIYLKAKRQSKVGKAITILATLMLIIFVCLRLFGINNLYLDMVTMSVFIGCLVNADGGSFISYVPKSKLLTIIERQVNYPATKDHGASANPN